MTDDARLLREYVTTRSPDAFAELARRYTDLVYSSAKRQLGGDAHLAEDVTQAVFVILAQKAKSVSAERPLSGWLLKVTGYCAANARRQQGRRQSHEQRAAHMARSNDSQSPEWNELSPLLDQGLNKLGRADRDALLLRFFEHKTLREVAASMGTSEEAAQKRVTRAVEKLRGFFRRRGMATLSVATLTVLLEQQAVQAAPPALAATVGSGAAAAPTASAVAKGAMLAMTTHKAAAIAAVVVTVLAVGGGGTNMIRGKGEPPQWIKDRIAATRAATIPVAQASGSSVGFADGTTVTLLGMSDMDEGNVKQAAADLIGGLLGVGAPPAVPPPEGSQWWSLDGSAIAPLPVGRARINPGDQPGRRQVRFVLSMRGKDAASTRAGGIGLAGLSIQIDGVGSSAQSSDSRNNARVVYYVASMPQDAQQTRIRLGVASGPWREVANKPVRIDATNRATGLAVFGNVGDAENGCSVEVTGNRIPPGDWKVEVVLKDGKRLPAAGWRGFPDGKGEAYFNCNKDQVLKIIGSSRPYEWKTIESVALWPKEPVAATTQSAAAGIKGTNP